MRYLLLIFSLVILSSFEGDHDIHVSVTDIDIEQDGDVEITIKVFLDDLMNAVGLEAGTELPENYTGSDEMIKEFLEDTFILELNGEKVPIDIVDTSASLPAVWITIEYKLQDAISSLDLENKMLLDLFDDQTNMVNVDVKGTRYSELMDHESTTFVLSEL